jgi:hypothetical protein
MQTDAIFRLKIAFNNIPMRGLFFWEGMLSLNDEEYKKTVEENFISVMKDFPQEEKEAMVYYQEVLRDLRETRKDIFANPKVRNEVEKIRDALIAEAADETFIDIMKADLPKQG